MNVALVKLSALGDIVHALPVASALRRLRPDAAITWIVERRHAPVLRGHPAIDDVVVVDTRAWRAVGGAGDVRTVARALRGVRRRLREGRFDVAIDLQGLVKSGALTWATAAPVRIGASAGRCREPMSALFTNHRVTPPASAAHVVEQCLALLAPLGGGAKLPVEFDLPADADTEAAIDAFLASSGLKPRDRLVVLNPGAARPPKRWPVDRFAALAARLAVDDVARVLVAWGPGEAEMAHAIVAGDPRGRTVLAPPTDLHGLVALLRRATVMVSADSGPLHLAAALGVRCVGMYGPTSAIRNGPYGAGHRTFQAAEGRVESIAVDAVAAAVAELVA